MSVYELDAEQLGLAVADYLVNRLTADIKDKNVNLHWGVAPDGVITVRAVVEGSTRPTGEPTD